MVSLHSLGSPGKHGATEPTLLARFSPVSNIILRLLSGTLGFSVSGTSAPPTEPLGGVASISGRLWGRLDRAGLEDSSGRTCMSEAVFRGWFWAGDVPSGSGLVDVVMWVKGWAGPQDEETDRVLQLDSCSSSQRFFKRLKFPLWTVEGGGSATCREKVQKESLNKENWF